MVVDIDNISKTLQPYKDQIGLLASTVTILQFFSGALICRDIRKRGTTRGVSALPFIGGVAIGVLVLKFALMLQDKNMFNVNVAAILLNAIYVVFYSAYSDDRAREVWSPAYKSALLVAGLMTYTYFEDPAKVEYRYGMIVTLLMLLLMASPLIELREIVNEQDASSIPFPLTLMGFIVSFLWLIYGIILLNNFMIVQNMLGMMLCAVQLLLCFMYPEQSRDRTKDD